jgi:hypothetical protein
MVRIGEIYLGGKEGDSHYGIVYNSGVAFSLAKKSPINDVYEFESGKWEIEIQKDNQKIIARSKDILIGEQILRSGFDFCQKFLDLLSVSKKVSLNIENPGQDYILLFKNSDRMIARITNNADWGFGLEVTLQIIDKDGNITELPPLPQPNWHPSFRYYRISQLENDPYDAYRNLYLAFESLLQDITPINNHEREIDWLNRALNEIGQKLPLSDYVPLGTDPVSYITKVFYEHFRCKIFHAKNRNYIIPHEWADSEKLSEAYEGLLRLWRQMSVVFKKVPGGGSVVTYQGFMVFMDPIANQGFNIQFTDDPSPENISDTQVSPLGYTIYPTINNIYIRDYKPGIVLFKGNLEIPEQIGLQLIHRICMISGETLYTTSSYEEGIIPKGIDTLEYYVTFRMVNKTSPKTIF